MDTGKRAPFAWNCSNDSVTCSGEVISTRSDGILGGTSVGHIDFHHSLYDSLVAVLPTILPTVTFYLVTEFPAPFA